MFISRNEYIRLKDKERLNDELEKEIKKLEYLLNTRERTCKIGPWCIKCSHWTKDYSEVISQASDYYTMEDAYYGFPLPAEQWQRMIEAHSNGAITTERLTKWIFPNMTDEEVQAELESISAQAQTNTDQALERILMGQ